MRALEMGKFLGTVIAPAPTIANRSAKLTFPLASAREALAFMDAQQKRTGSTSALVTKGGGRPPDAPVVVKPPRVKRVAQSNLPRAPSGAVAAAWQQACPGEANDGAEELKGDGVRGAAMRVDAALVVWRLPCGSDHMLFLANERGSEVRQLSFKVPMGDRFNEIQVLPTVSFDPANLTVTSGNTVNCQPNLGQIGFAARWKWTGANFELTLYRAFRWAEAGPTGENEAAKDEELGCVTAVDWPAIWSTSPDPAPAVARRRTEPAGGKNLAPQPRVLVRRPVSSEP